jgi:tetratricopeptide (TPR) repeat protein
VLAHVVGQVVEALAGPLSALCAAELLQEAQRYPVAEYRFWHPLTQEVAYGTLLGGRRTRLHAAVAEALIEHEPARLDERAAVVAWHWERAGHSEEAARWNLRAGAFALRSDVTEAQRRWRAACDLLEAADETPERLGLRVQALTRLLQYGARAGMDPREAELLFQDGRVLAERLNDLRLLTMLVYVSGSARIIVGDVRGGLSRWLEAARLGEPVDDPSLQSALANGPALATAWTGPLDEALAWADRALSVLSEEADEGPGLVGYSLLVRALVFRAMALVRMGRLTEASADAGRALLVGRPRAEPENLVFNIAVLCEAAWLTGQAGDTLALAAEAVRIGENTGNVLSLVLALDALTLADLVTGRAREAVIAAERALAEAQRRRVALFLEAKILAQLARARLDENDLEGAARTADEAVAAARQRGTRVFECLALLIRSQVAVALGATADDMYTDLDNALALVTKTGAVAYEPMIREARGNLHIHESELREALQLYEAIGATGHARRLASELAGSTGVDRRTARRYSIGRADPDRGTR